VSGEVRKTVSAGEIVTLRIHATDSSLAEASRVRDWNLLRYSNPGTKCRSSSMNPAMESSSDGGEESRSEEHSGDSPDKTPEESSPQRRMESERQLEQETDMAIGGDSFCGRGHGFR